MFNQLYNLYAVLEGNLAQARKYYIPFKEKVPVSSLNLEEDVKLNDSKSDFIFFAPELKYSGNSLVEYLAFSYVELVVVEDKIEGIEFPLFHTIEQANSEPQSSFWMSVSNYRNENCKIIDGNYTLHMILAQSEELYEGVKDLLRINNELKSKKYTTELNILYIKLQRVLEANEAPGFLVKFYQCIVKFFLSKYCEVKEISSALNTPPKSHLGEMIQYFVNKILEFIGSQIDIDDQLKHKIMLIASSDSLSDKENINSIEAIKEVFAKHGIEIQIPPLESINDIPKLLAYVNEMAPMDVCFMGHGNSEQGISVVVGGKENKLTLNDILSLQISNKTECFIILACDADFYNSLSKEGKLSVDLIHNVGIFSFQKIELFCAGFTRGRSLNRKIEDCVMLGRTLLELRHNFNVDIKHDNGEKTTVSSLAFYS